MKRIKAEEATALMRITSGEINFKHTFDRKSNCVRLITDKKVTVSPLCSRLLSSTTYVTYVGAFRALSSWKEDDSGVN